jgi:hypothetical protein
MAFLVLPDELDRLKVKVPHVWQQGNGPCTLNGMRQGPLVLGAGTRNAPRNDLASLGGEVLQRPGILVIDLKTLVGAESAYLAPVENSSFFSSGAGF